MLTYRSLIGLATAAYLIAVLTRAVDWQNTMTSVESFALESPRTLDLLNAKNMPQKPKPIDGISTENATEVSFDIPKWINTTI